MLEKVAEQYPLSLRSRENAITALVGLLTKTPLGNQIGLGREVVPGKRVMGALNKDGWPEIEMLAVLYSLYRYAEKVGRHQITLSELYENAVEGPYTLFGIGREPLRRILQGMSARGGNWLKTDLVRDLDNIFMDDNLKSDEVLRIEC